MAISDQNKKILTWGLAIVGVGLGISVYQYAKNQIKKLSQMQFNFAGVKMPRIRKGEVTIDFSYEVVNPSDLNVMVSNQRYKLFLNGKQVAVIYNDDQIVIAPESTSTLPLTAKFTVRKALEAGIANVSDLVFNQENINFIIIGTVDLQSEFLYVNDFKYTDHYTLKEVVEM